MESVDNVKVWLFIWNAFSSTFRDAIGFFSQILENNRENIKKTANIDLYHGTKFPFICRFILFIIASTKIRCFTLTQV